MNQERLDRQHKLDDIVLQIDIARETLIKNAIKDIRYFTMYDHEGQIANAIATLNEYYNPMITRVMNYTNRHVNIAFDSLYQIVYKRIPVYGRIVDLPFDRADEIRQYAFWEEYGHLLGPRSPPPEDPFEWARRRMRLRVAERPLGSLFR